VPKNNVAAFNDGQIGCPLAELRRLEAEEEERNRPTMTKRHVPAGWASAPAQNLIIITHFSYSASSPFITKVQRHQKRVKE